MNPIRLGVNVDHIATIRQQRLGHTPDPVEFALTAQAAGAHSIVAHLREDRRHIQDADIRLLKESLEIPLNMEMSVAPDVVKVALKVCPHQVTLVPEKRRELTTEGGLDVCKTKRSLKKLIREFQGCGITVSLFIDPDESQWQAALECGATAVELHTGAYADAANKSESNRILRQLQQAARQARQAGLEVAAGHGLTVSNVYPIAAVPEIEELNIGYAIVADALDIGFRQAVRNMLQAMRRARRQAKE